MPPAFVQSKGGTSNTLSSLPIAFTSNNTAGNLLVCSGVVNTSTIGGLTITDTQGNTWTIALVDNWKSLSTFFMAYALNCKAGANTVTIAQLGSLISGAISEYSGVAPAASLDVSGFSDSGSGIWTAATSGNVITRENGELIVAAQGNSTGPASVTLGSGFSNLQNDSGNFVSIESQVQATAGAIAGTFTISASSGACGVLTFVPPTDALPFNVWTPSGVTVSGTDVGNPSAIWDTSPIVLVGPTNVMKFWYGNYSTGKLYYMESADGLTSWTPYGSNPITVGSGIYFPVVWKVGSTYYLFAAPTVSFQSIVLYTSSTPIGPWTSQGTVINVGGGGTWDAGAVAQLNLCAIVGGVWYAYYYGQTAAGVTGLGLVTSTNGTTWTKSASNPLITCLNGGQTAPANFMQINGVYYAWAAADYNNSFTKSQKFHSIFRWSAPSPSGPWTMLAVNGSQVSTYYPANTTDFVDTSIDTQVGDQCMVVANNNIYLYYDTGHDGSEGSNNQAIASGITPAQLVSSYEGVVGVPISGAPQLNLSALAIDSGTGANANPIGGNWTTATGQNAVQRNSNLFEAGSAVSGHLASIAYWNALTWGNDQWVQITIEASATSSTGVGATCRQSASANTLYYFFFAGPVGSTVTWQISKIVAGVGTVIATGSGLPLSVGDTILGVINGTGLYIYWNNILIYGTTDSSIASGNAGLYVQGTTSGTSLTSAQAWSGGTFRDAPLVLASVSGNAGVGGATITYSGASSGSVTADSFGNYLLSNLPDGSYTITPSLSGYTFSPTSSNQILSGTNITGVNFVATQQSSTTAGPSSGLQSVQLYGRLANGSIVAVSVDINGNLAVSGGTGGAINSVDVLKNGVATPAMVYGVTSAGKLVAVAVDANGNLCCANVGAGGGNSNTTVDIAKYATPTPVQAVGREPISGKLYAVPLNASNSLYDSVHPGATPTSLLTVPGVAPRPVQLCGRAPNGKIIAVALDTSGRLCISGSGQSGSANAVDAFKNGVPLAIQLFGINSAGKLQPVPLDANGNLELS